ncbi:MAG: H-type small acid-soluble spore protein [Clostridia bacterium]|nr:H-type small acid-soluble spore protein [Clostridia bacterium]
MNIQRVEEILHSSDITKVFYKGSSVWIRKVKGNQVEIKDIYCDTICNVAVEDLKEMQ